MISDLYQRMLSIRKCLKPRHHDHLLIAWAASIQPFESIAASKVLAQGEQDAIPYFPMCDIQLDNAYELMAWGLLDADYTITLLGSAIVEYDLAISHPFLAEEDPPESMPVWGLSPV